VAVNEDGRAVASMGVDAADCAGAGREELFMTNLTGEGSSLFIQSAPGEFQDLTRERKLMQPSLPFTGFGAFFFDYDLDGWLDLFVANGLVTIPGDRTGHDPKFPLDQRSQLFRNLGGCSFEDVSARAGPALRRSGVGRGASVGDLDNDGDPDIVVINNSGPARVLLNVAGAGRNWLGLRLVDRRRDVFGARATVEPPRTPPLRRRVHTDGSYASARDPRLLFGLGGWNGPVTVTVDWPGGARERFPAVPGNRYTTLTKGTAATRKPGD
jgi:enediyne biosynthesis protein E4